MLFVYVSDIQQIAEQSFYLPAADYIRLCYVLKTAAVTQILLGLRHRCDIGNGRILHQILFQPSV